MMDREHVLHVDRLVVIVVLEDTQQQAFDVSACDSSPPDIVKHDVIWTMEAVLTVAWASLCHRYPPTDHLCPQLVGTSHLPSLKMQAPCFCQRYICQQENIPEKTSLL